MNIFQRIFGGPRKPPPPPPEPLPIDEQPGFIGDLLRMGEAAAGDGPQIIEPPVAGTPAGPKRGR